MKRTLLVALSMVFGSAVYAQNNVPHTEGFESYNVGPLAPQGGWETWDQVPTVNGLVNTTQARTGTKSVKIVTSEGGQSDTDLIHRYFNHTFDGCYTYKVYHYLPGNQSGETYFILLSDYVHGQGQNNTWAVQLHFNAQNDTVIADFGLEQVSTIEDQWVEIRVEIDVPADEHQIFYGGTPIFPAPKSWIDAMNGGNFPLVSASDYYANAAGGATCCQFYDDLDFQKVACAGTTCQFKIAKVKAKNCDSCPGRNDIISNDQPCEDAGDCPKKFKTTIDCPGGGNGSCIIKKAKKDSCA
jgi:hypothetical protein